MRVQLLDLTDAKPRKTENRGVTLAVQEPCFTLARFKSTTPNVWLGCFIHPKKLQECQKLHFKMYNYRNWVTNILSEYYPGISGTFMCVDMWNWISLGFGLKTLQLAQITKSDTFI